MMEYLTGTLALAFTALFTITAFTRNKPFAPKSRLELTMSALDAATLLLIARTLTPWGNISPWLWLLPVAVYATGIAATTLRWPSLPFLHPDKTRRRTLTWTIVHVSVLAGVITLILG
ncbi:hypothetical protein [Luethyella okanaganae]|uniref:Integral membrane protein n=1 Tax=Luethyella okanaganae TaxID=69372 RepID=A0ABW1VGC6_9MICO